MSTLRVLLLAAVACSSNSVDGPSVDAGTLADGSRLDAPNASGPLAAIIGSAHNVLWVGAHPDDENYVAPLLYDMCNLHGASCAFLVVTDGGKGCKLSPAECGFVDKGGMPAGSIGALRHKEMVLSASFFHGQLDELAREDTASATPTGDVENWNQSYSGIPNDTGSALITQKVKDAITQFHPDVIVTFDPRHGVYCHPDHRAASALTLNVAVSLGFDLSRVLMIESAELYVDANNVITSRAWVPSDPALLRYDAAAAATWSARSTVFGIHKSQFPAAVVDIIANVPTAARVLAFLRVSDVLVNDAPKVDPDYEAVCATEAAWDGHGVCPTANGVGPCF